VDVLTKGFLVMGILIKVSQATDTLAIVHPVRGVALSIPVGAKAVVVLDRVSLLVLLRMVLAALIALTIRSPVASTKARSGLWRIIPITVCAGFA
jgi:hypothetical protein